MTYLTEFLLARITEDEHAASKLEDADLPASVFGAWNDGQMSEQAYEDEYSFADRFSPSRQLAESKAKRRIVYLYEALSMTGGKDASLAWVAMGDVLKDLATAYEDHPDYGKGWEVAK